VGDGPLVARAARQPDQSSTGQFDVDEEERADGDDDERPQQAVDDVRLRVDLVGNGVVERLGVVETAERPALPELTYIPLNVLRVLPLRLVADTERTLRTETPVFSLNHNLPHFDDTYNTHTIFAARCYAQAPPMPSCGVRLSVRLFGWLRGTVVERRSLSSELPLSCARPAADG